MQFQHTIGDALRRLPGAVALYAFGSLATRAGDMYSDVDLELLTTDLDASIEARHDALAQVGAISLEWRIDPSRSGWAATLLFDGVSPYHKLDLGFTSACSGGVPPVGHLDDAVLLWRQSPGSLISQHADEPPYAPAVGTTEHWVMGQVLGAVRYAKARHRRQDLTCWRFASALANGTLALLSARHAGEPLANDRRLSTTDYLRLDRVLPDATRVDVLSLLDFSTPERMDEAVLQLLKMVIREANMSGRPLEHLLAFVEIALVSPHSHREEQPS